MWSVPHEGFWQKLCGRWDGALTAYPASDQYARVRTRRSGPAARGYLPGKPTGTALALAKYDVPAGNT